MAHRCQITTPFRSAETRYEFESPRTRNAIFLVSVMAGLVAAQKVSAPGFRRPVSEGDSTRETFHARESRAPCDFSRRVSRTRMRTGDARFAERA